MACTVQYASTRKEIWRWYWRSWRRGLWIIHALWFCAIASAVALMGVSNNLSAPAAGFLALAAGFVSVAWMPLFPMVQFKPQTRTLTVNESGVSSSIGSKSGVRTWGQIRSVNDEDGAIVITLKNKNAFIIPSRAFENAESRAEFLAYATAAFQTAT